MGNIWCPHLVGGEFMFLCATVCMLVLVSDKPIMVAIHGVLTWVCDLHGRVYVHLSLK